MYTNSGILAMMKPSNIASNLDEVRCSLRMAEDGAIEISQEQYDDLKRWEEDMHDYFIRLAEQNGMTNVRNDSMHL